MISFRIHVFSNYVLTCHMKMLVYFLLNNLPLHKNFTLFDKNKVLRMVLERDA